MGHKIVKVKIVQYSCFNNIALVHSGIFSPIRTRRTVPSMAAGSVISVVIKLTRVMCCGRLLVASLYENFFSFTNLVTTQGERHGDFSAAEDIHTNLVANEVPAGESHGDFSASEDIHTDLVTN